ncbi:Probable transcription repressor NiaR [Yersinia kristensenii]|uniref:Probable transcription repressor NiaR n=1 Tax=Yersinia kristensenii TaxID=28152 RepID=A0A0T9L5Y1_YERKR|nr:Probable transcription repressor NiaR [Yersinia kristensenii]CNE61224.1 Probable transcription repressor NiaR [Yersinia kristensenii]
MSRSQRLLDLIQILRRHRYPVTGAVLAEELAVSVRTLYRDIATLQQQGAQPPHSRRLYALMRIFFG